jgi:hypothetical protein
MQIKANLFEPPLRNNGLNSKKVLTQIQIQRYPRTKKTRKHKNSKKTKKKLALAASTAELAGAWNISSQV